MTNFSQYLIGRRPIFQVTAEVLRVLSFVCALVFICLFAAAKFDGSVGETIRLSELPYMILFISVFFLATLININLKRAQVQTEDLALQNFKPGQWHREPELYAQLQSEAFFHTRSRKRADIIHKCVEKGQDHSVLHETLPAASVSDAIELSTGYVPLLVCAWMLPVLGFIGTALGMASAISGLSTLIEKKINPDNLANLLASNVIPGLSDAFLTTVFALGATIVTYWCTSALKRRDQILLKRLDERCVDFLASVPSPDQLLTAAFRQIVEQVKSFGERSPTSEAAEAIKVATQALTAVADKSISASNEIADATTEMSTAAKAFLAATIEAVAASKRIGAAAHNVAAAANITKSVSDGLVDAAREASNEIIVAGNNSRSVSHDLAGAAQMLANTTTGVIGRVESINHAAEEIASSNKLLTEAAQLLYRHAMAQTKTQ